MSQFSSAVVGSFLTLIFFVCGYLVGREEVLSDIERYGKYTIDANKELVGVIRPLVEPNKGELQYLRPNGKKVIHV